MEDLTYEMVVIRESGNFSEELEVAPMLQVDV